MIRPFSVLESDQKASHAISSSSSSKDEEEKKRKEMKSSAYLLEAEVAHQGGEMGQFAYDSGEDDGSDAEIDLSAYRTGFKASDHHDDAKDKKYGDKDRKSESRGYQQNREKHEFQKVARMMEDRYGDKVSSSSEKASKKRRK